MKWKLCCTAHINCTFLCLKEKFSDVIIWTVSFYQVKSAKSWVLLEESLKKFFWEFALFFNLELFWAGFFIEMSQKAWFTGIWKLGEKVPEKKTQWPNPRRNCPRRNCRRRKNILPAWGGLDEVPWGPKCTNNSKKSQVTKRFKDGQKSSYPKPTAHVDQPCRW